ncbi:MAG: zinc-ribbon domain-containing protein, partial [Clostridia bacterium]|nr:zinc-ribbon domain-containing protein [Clostridia bacterium]
KAPLPQGAKFCATCGAAVPTKKFCTNCGTQLSSADRFCSTCGQKQF